MMINHDNTPLWWISFGNAATGDFLGVAVTHAPTPRIAVERAIGEGFAPVSPPSFVSTVFDITTAYAHFANEEEAGLALDVLHCEATIRGAGAVPFGECPPIEQEMMKQFIPMHRVEEV